jgi:hypothetical protein
LRAQRELAVRNDNSMVALKSSESVVVSFV